MHVFERRLALHGSDDEVTKTSWMSIRKASLYTSDIPGWLADCFREEFMARQA